MIKSDRYYKFIAPAHLVFRELPITKENIESEVQRLKMLDSEAENNEVIYNDNNIVNLDGVNKNATTLQIISNNSGISTLDISKLSMPLLNSLVAPSINLYFDSYNEKLNYSGIKYIDVHSLSSSYGNGLIGADFKSLTTLIIRSEYIVAGLYSFLHNSPIVNGKGYVYVPDSLLQVYKLQYADTPTILNAIKPISEIK